MKRRDFLQLSAAAVAAASAGPARALEGAEPLAMPPLLDTTSSGRLELTSRIGRSRFAPGAAETVTVGFDRPYLGPTLRIRNGPLAARVQNGLDETINVHWHGLLVPGIHDGPHSPILPGESWRPDMQIGQSPATLWYHSHMHGRTAPQVYWGLAGALQITDGRDDQRGLPSAYGIDDLMLIIQDRRFDGKGRMVYAPSMTDVLNGFHGDRIMVNGQIGRVAVVPRGVVRLRLLNASNARTYMLSFADRRPMHLVATDSGYVARPAALTFLRLAPAERAEVLVDFSDGGPALLRNTRGLEFPVLHFAADSRLPVRITTPPEALDEDSAPAPDPALPLRRLTLNMGGGSGELDHSAAGHAAAEAALSHPTPAEVAEGPGSAAGMIGAGVSDFAINGRSYDAARVDFDVKLGSRERWLISGGGAIDHPFHVHGCRFRVLSTAGGAAPSAQDRGWKDVVLVSGEAMIEMEFPLGADARHPYMTHCHILEHEDAGMMAQFTVT